MSDKEDRIQKSEASAACVSLPRSILPSEIDFWILTSEFKLITHHS